MMRRLYFISRVQCKESASGKHSLVVHRTRFSVLRAQSTVFLRCRWCDIIAAYIEACARCEGDGWIEDPTACGDPEHCSPLTACSCNPNHLRPDGF